MKPLPSPSPSPSRTRIAALLWGLTMLFAFRILAQPLALVVPAQPDFTAWHGGTMPYPLLLVLQLSILAVMVATNLRMNRAGLPSRPRLARGLTVLGAVYFVLMLARWIVGQTVATAPAWFDRPLPSFFHLVLATWLLLVARELGRAHE